MRAGGGRGGGRDVWSCTLLRSGGTFWGRGRAWSLEMGANTCAMDANRDTPADLARRSGHNNVTLGVWGGRGGGGRTATTKTKTMRAVQQQQQRTTAVEATEQQLRQQEQQWQPRARMRARARVREGGSGGVGESKGLLSALFSLSILYSIHKIILTPTRFASLNFSAPELPPKVHLLATCKLSAIIPVDALMA